MFDPLAPKATKTAIPISCLDKEEAAIWLKAQPARQAKWARANAFEAKPGQCLMLPGEDGSLERVIWGRRSATSPWSYAALPAALPPGRYRSEGLTNAADANALALGWMLGTYRFDRYKTQRKAYASLSWPEAADREEITALTEGICLCRDLINTPAEDLGPAELAAAAAALASQHGAKVRVLRGKRDLQRFPAVYAVGRASSRPPHLIDMRAGDEAHPKVTLVGKGVVFDSGGLDLKSAANMKLMKKDMGGAALVLGVAHYVLSRRLPIRLRVLIPAVENSVSGDALRPLDVIHTRLGLRVEVGNTDAEGRLILCDALAAADEESPDLLIDAATLTGAARVALGTGLPALFSNEDALAEQLLASGKAAEDPLWRLPLHAPYDSMLDSAVADLNNVSDSPYAGAILGGLFLQRFVGRQTRWAHIDTMAWNTDNKPGRPAGGEAMGLRALARLLSNRYPRR